MSPNLSVLALPKNTYFLLVGANLQIFHPDYTQSLAFDSAIGLYLLQNPNCAQHYDDSRFSILAQGRLPFYLSALEATFIKTFNPALC